jgi:hypothetical protein
MERKEAMHAAYWHCRDAAENAMRAQLCIGLGYPGYIYEECLREAFAEAAKALGYDLVPAKTKQEAA